MIQYETGLLLLGGGTRQNRVTMFFHENFILQFE